mgnify:CR=1 FL=1|jgi:hypothetical protein
MQPGRQVKLSKIWNEVFKEGLVFQVSRVTGTGRAERWILR